jgi:hypothetical protein
LLLQDDQELAAVGRATSDFSWPILVPVATKDERIANSLEDATVFERL